MYAYEQCLLVFGHHPDVWCEACVWLENVSRILQQKGDAANSKSFADAVANLYERAISHLMKYNHLMYFAYADYEEVRTLRRPYFGSLPCALSLVSSFLVFFTAKWCKLQ